MSQSDLARFIEAQAPVAARVEAELAAGAKHSHWMWFVFPQLAALGRSQMAVRYGLADLADAQAYLAHPLLRERLMRCTQLVTSHPGKSAHEIMGSPDELKLRSCMTLFALADPHEPLFKATLDQLYAGQPCGLTLQALNATWL